MSEQDQGSLCLTVAREYAIACGLKPEILSVSAAGEGVLKKFYGQEIIDGFLLARHARKTRRRGCNSELRKHHNKLKLYSK